MEISYAKPMYEFVKRVAGDQSVCDWTADLLEPKGYQAFRRISGRTAYTVDGGSDDLDLEVFSMVREKRSSSQETLDTIRSTRANHAKIAYCCEHLDSAKCRDHLCYI